MPDGAIYRRPSNIEAHEAWLFPDGERGAATDLKTADLCFGEQSIGLALLLLQLNAEREAEAGAKAEVASAAPDDDQSTALDASAGLAQEETT